MRFSYLVLSILFVSFSSLAKVSTFKDLLAESEGLRKKISSLKDHEQKKTELKKWEDKIQATVKEYLSDEANTKAGAGEVDLVIKLSLAMAPVFETVKTKISDDNCENAEHQITLEDRDMTKDNPSAMSLEGQEALNVLKLFCKK